ncbi:alkene reductase [Micromonospora chokoriensis]
MPVSNEKDLLLTSFHLGDLRLPNRVVMAPMARVRAAEGGLATASMATYYAQRASAGLIVTEGVQPSLIGQSNPGTPGLHTDAQTDSWRQVTGAVHANGGRIFAQLMHGGRVSHPATSGQRPIGPSEIAGEGSVFTVGGPQPMPVPRALITHEVREQAESFAAAGRRAMTAGFDGVELHGANGYLIQQFLSTNANLRTDRYGGSIRNRIRFAVEAVTSTVEAVGAARTGIRLSPDAGIWGVREADASALYTALLAELAPLGLAYIHVIASVDDEVLIAMRKAWPDAMIVNPNHPLNTARSDRAAAERWLRHGADLISFGRAFIGNPDLVERLRRGLPLADEDPAYYYGGGDNGYTTYSSYREDSVESSLPTEEDLAARGRS